MFTRHRLGPTNKLDCPHAMGTNAFSPHRAESFRHFLLLPSPHSTPSLRSVAQGKLRLFTTDASRNLLVSIGSRAAQFQASGLRVRGHAGACGLASLIVSAHQLFFDPKR